MNKRPIDLGTREVISGKLEIYGDDPNIKGMIFAYQCRVVAWYEVYLDDVCINSLWLEIDPNWFSHFCKNVALETPIRLQLGAGPSTPLKLSLESLRIHDGHIILDGQDLESDAVEIINRIGEDT